MGNHKLRRELGRRLKEAGYGRLYMGNKRRAFRFLRAALIKRLLYLSSLREGDLVNDCDGFNHRIKKIETYRDWTGILDFRQFEFEDGQWSCGCPISRDRPRTVEEIERWLNHSDETIARWKSGGWWSAIDQIRLDRIRAGLPVTDEFGIKLPLEDMNNDG